MSAGRGTLGPQLDDDAIALLVLAVFLVGPLIAMLAGAGDGIATWLADHGVLTRAGVLIEFAAGIGLDPPRIAVAAGVLLAIIAWAVHLVQRRGADRSG